MLLLITLIIVIAVPLALKVMSRRMDSRRCRRIITAVLICYAAVVLYLTLVSRSYYASVRIVLDPFVVYRRLIQAVKAAAGSGGWQAALKRLVNNPWVKDNIVPNILLLLPLGYLLPAAGTCLADAQVKQAGLADAPAKQASRADAQERGSWLTRRWYGLLLVGLLASALIETLQLVLHLGVFDAADLMHNTIGALIGYWVYCLIIRKG